MTGASGVETGIAQGSLLPMLQELDRLLESAVAAAPAFYGWDAGRDAFRGLYINEQDARRTLLRGPCFPLPAAAPDRGDAWLQHGPMARLAERYDLDAFDCGVLLLALAPEIDVRYERVYAYLQDDVTRRRPAVDLVLNLLCDTAEEKIERRRHFEPQASLIRHKLIELLADPAQPRPPLLAHYIKLDEIAAGLLLDRDGLDSRLAAFCAFSRAEISLASLPLERAARDGLFDAAQQAHRSGRPARFYFRGPDLPLRKLTAEALSYDLGARLLLADLGRFEDNPLEAIGALFRYAANHGVMLFLDHADSLAFDSGELRYLTESLAASSCDAILAGAAAWPAGRLFDDAGIVEIEFGTPAFKIRREQWRSNLSVQGCDLPDAQLDSLADLFHLHSDQIAAASVAARNRAWQRGSEQPSLEDCFRAARAQSGQALATLTRKVEPLYGWADIVLPEPTLAQLRDVCNRVRRRRQVFHEWGFDSKLSLGKGVTALFAGPSGVGKTMAAEIIARELALDLYKIDLAGVVSKYIGETEKNLDRIFAAAESSDAILFFDEADALFGKRSEVRDSHDRYANIEISYLLQKMEAYRGVAILASNLRQHLDESFLRRLAFTIHFPFPDEEHRRGIWKSVWPQAAPLDSAVDFDFLASRFKLSGGNIRNAALSAAFLAAEEGGTIAMRHLLRGVEREYQKMGKPLGRDQFQPYSIGESTREA